MKQKEQEYPEFFVDADHENDTELKMLLTSRGNTEGDKHDYPEFFDKKYKNLQRSIADPEYRIDADKAAAAHVENEYTSMDQRAYVAKYRSRKITKYDNLRAWCISYAGGKCVRCGYKEFSSVLQFHHLDRKLKAADVSQLASAAISQDEYIKDAVIVLRIEIEKCMLLCSNCHHSYHHGHWIIDTEFIENRIGTLKSMDNYLLDTLREYIEKTQA